MVQVFQEQIDVSRWWTVFWMTFDRNHDRKCGKSARGYLGRLTTNDSRCLEHCRTVVWNVPANFVGWTQHEVHCSKICAKVAEQWSKGIPHFRLHWVQRTGRKDPNFISNIITGDESWVFGYDAETKQQLSHWKTPTSPRPKKPQHVQNNLNSMLNIFLGVKASCIRNLFQQDRWWMENYIAMFWGEWGKSSRQAAQKLLGPASWQSSASRIARCVAVLGFYEYKSSPTLPTHWTSPPATFSYSWRWNWSLRGDFWQH